MVKRYATKQDFTHEYMMSDDPDGRYVDFADYDALAARLAEAERLLSGCRTSFGFVNSILHESIDAFLRPAVSAIPVQPDAVLRDAERYRYMRNNASFRDRNGPGLYWYLPRFLPGDGAEKLDAAIDSQLRAADPTDGAT